MFARSQAGLPRKRSRGLLSSLRRRFLLPFTRQREILKTRALAIACFRNEPDLGLNLALVARFVWFDPAESRILGSVSSR